MGINLNFEKSRRLFIMYLYCIPIQKYCQLLLDWGVYYIIPFLIQHGYMYTYVRIIMVGRPEMAEFSPNGGHWSMVRYLHSECVDWCVVYVCCCSARCRKSGVLHKRGPKVGFARSCLGFYRHTYLGLTTYHRLPHGHEHKEIVPKKYFSCAKSKH